MFIAGMIGFLRLLLLLTWESAWNWPIDIGGRPPFSWPVFVPIAFELGILCAVGAGFLGYFVINRMPTAVPSRSTTACRWAERCAICGSSRSKRGCRAAFRMQASFSHDAHRCASRRSPRNEGPPGILLFSLVLLVGCDYMINQPKQKTYSPRSVRQRSQTISSSSMHNRLRRRR